MFEINYKGQTLQITRLEQCGNGVKFFAVPSDNPDGRVYNGFILVSPNTPHGLNNVTNININDDLLDTRALTRCIPHHNHKTLVWVRSPEKVSALGLMNIDCYDGTGYHALVIKVINYAHQLTNYFDDPLKRYDASTQFAAVLSVSLSDGSELVRCWVNTGLYIPGWIYKREGITYTQVDTVYQS